MFSLFQNAGALQKMLFIWVTHTQFESSEGLHQN